MRARDFQRKKIYKAENAAMRCCYPVDRLELDECRQLVSRACKFLGLTTSPLVTDGRGTKRASGTMSKINLPKWARNKWIVLHEVAHACTPRSYPAHGREFASTYLKLVRRFIGKIEAQILRDAFRQYKAKYRKISQ